MLLKRTTTMAIKIKRNVKKIYFNKFKCLKFANILFYLLSSNATSDRITVYQLTPENFKGGSHSRPFRFFASCSRHSTGKQQVWATDSFQVELCTRPLGRPPKTMPSQSPPPPPTPLVLLPTQPCTTPSFPSLSLSRSLCSAFPSDQCVASSIQTASGQNFFPLPVAASGALGFRGVLILELGPLDNLSSLSLHKSPTRTIAMPRRLNSSCLDE